MSGRASSATLPFGRLRPPEMLSWTEAFWTAFLRGLVKRGLVGVQLRTLRTALLDVADVEHACRDLLDGAERAAQPFSLFC